MGKTTTLSTTYTCEICEHVFNQKSHYTEHKKKKVPCGYSERKMQEIIEYKIEEEKRIKKMQNLVDELNNKYDKFSSYTKNGSIRTMKSKILKDLKEFKKSNIESYKKLFQEQKWSEFIKLYGNKTLNDVDLYWNYSDSENDLVITDLDDNEEKKEYEYNDKKYNELKGKIDSVIKGCHKILYNNGNIVGRKAMDDIMKVFTLKLFQPMFLNQDSFIYNKTKKLRSKDQYILYCQNIEELAKEDDIMNEWKKLVKNFLCKVLPEIYDEKDILFNCNDRTLKEIILKISKVGDIFYKSENINNYDTISGDIYEYFVNGYLSGGGKELGQFFTPRKLIDLTVHALVGNYFSDNNIDINNVDIYDCCMGSGGFLTRTFNILKIKPDNVYGQEIEIDTIKFGFSNLLLTLKQFPKHCNHRNSITDEDHMKYMLIITNPPFGIKMKYVDLKVKYLENENKKKKENELYKIIPFENVYPVKTNNGACLFVQHCVYKLKQDGMCCVVLPDGELFFGKTFKKFRKWLCENVNILSIIKVPPGTFEHTSISTCVLQFVKKNTTKSLQFYDTTTNCRKLKSMVKLSLKQLKEENYSFDPKDYIEEKVSKNVEWKKFDEICNIGSGMLISAKSLTNGKFKVYGGGNIIGMHNKSNRKNHDIILTRVGDIKITYATDDYYLTDNGLYIEIKDTNILPKFLYYYLKYFKFDDLKYLYKGNGRKVISQTRIKDNIQIAYFNKNTQQNIINNISVLEQQQQNITNLIKSTKQELKLVEEYSFSKIINEKLRDCKYKKNIEICNFERKSHIRSGEKKKSGKYNFYVCSNNIYKYDEFLYSGENIILSSGGNFCIHFSKKPFHCSTDVHVFNSKIIDNKFIYYYIKNNKNKFEKLMKGNGIKHFTKTQALNIKIPIVSNEKQQELIEIYEQKEQQIKQYEEHIQNLKQRLQDIDVLEKDIIESYF